jgi:tetratricopeptide (TPR) repeat protein
VLAVAVVAAVAAFDARRKTTVPTAPRPAATPSFLLRPAPPSAEVESALAKRPEDLETAVLLVRAYIREGRAAEAEVAMGRLRQIPGASTDPLSDYVDGLLATSRGEKQRALASTTRGLERAIAGQRGDLVAMLRLGRARALSDLGRNDESLSERRVARREAERAGDDVATAVALNDLAVEALSEGEFAAGEKLLALALPVARRAGDDARLAFIEFNLGTIAHLRGRPDLGELHVREAIRLFENVGNRRRVAISRVALAEILWDRGESSAARAMAETALADLQEIADHHAIASAQALRARLDLEGGELGAVEEAFAPIERSARESGTPARLELVENLRGRLASARRRFDEALAAFEAAGALAARYGSSEDVAHEALAATRVDLASGRPDRAAERLARIEAEARLGAGTSHRFAFDLLRTRLDLARDRNGEARARIDALGDFSRSPSLERRLEFLAVRGALLAAEGRMEEARRDFEAARAAATAGGRTVTELELLLEETTVERLRGEPGRGRASAAALVERSRAIGLDALAAEANRLRELSR